jgi:hypothetical protein
MLEKNDNKSRADEKPAAVESATVGGMTKLSPLTKHQIAQYREEGYVFPGRIVDEAALEALRAEEARFRGTPGPNELTVFRGQLCHHSPVVRQFCLTGAHLDLIEQLVGPNVCQWYNQFVTKLPDAASGWSEFPWHQDNGYVAIEPANNVTIWLALDDVDERNGCVWVMPGSHQGGLLPHRSQSAENWHLRVAVEGDGIPARLKAGEAVIFSGLTLHRSKLNHTDQPRRAFFMEYADAEAMYRKVDNEPIPVVMSGQSWVARGQIAWPPRPELKLYR